MTNSLILEVVGGPMDGLNSTITKKGAIGRSVGNALSLGMDREISSRHAEVFREGPSWCVLDLNSTNGTIYHGDRLKPNRTYPLEVYDVLLFGATVIEVLPGQEGDHFSAFSDAGFRDPRETFTMTAELRQVWDRLYGEIADKEKGDYCDSEKLFIALMKTAGAGKDAKDYDCVIQVQQPSKYGILNSWLLAASLDYSYKTPPNAYTIAPRVWRIMNLAAERKPEKIGVGDILGAMLEEAHSLSARHMLADKRFMEAFGPKLRRGASDKTVFELVKGPKEAAPKPPPPPQQPQPAPPSASERQEITDTSGSTKCTTPTEQAVRDEIWKYFGQRIERVVHGFMSDAVNPMGSMQQDFAIPGMQKKLDEILPGGGDPVAANQLLKQYLDIIYNLLVAILSTHREGYKHFAEKLCAKIEQETTETKEGMASMLPLGKKSIDIHELGVKLRLALQHADSEGLSENIIREILRAKLKKFWPAPQR